MEWHIAPALRLLRSVLVIELTWISSSFSDRGAGHNVLSSANRLYWLKGGMQIFASTRSAGAVKELQRTTNKDPRREHSGIPGERGALCPVSLSFDLTRMPGQTVASMSTDSEADVLN